MKVAFLGATKGMGRALARLLAERGDALFLLGRDLEDLERSARDLEVRVGAEDRRGRALRSRTARDLRPGARRGRGGPRRARHRGRHRRPLRDRRKPSRRTPSGPAACSPWTSPTPCSSARRPGARLLARGGGTLCVFSSVAGERGRKPVVLYGAAKAGLSRYLEGLDHKFHGAGLRVVCVKPGFVKTSMTAGLHAAALRRRARRRGAPRAAGHRPRHAGRLRSPGLGRW